MLHWAFPKFKQACPRAGHALFDEPDAETEGIPKGGRELVGEHVFPQVERDLGGRNGT